MPLIGFDIPRGIILPVERVDVTLDRAPHPFEAANRAAIHADWLREKAANPSLFDGEVSLLARLVYRDRALEGACHGSASRRSCTGARRGPGRMPSTPSRSNPGDQRRRADCHPHGHAHGQSGPRLLRRRFVRSAGLSRRQGRRRSQHGARGGRGDRARHRRPAARPSLPRAVGRNWHDHLSPLLAGAPADVLAAAIRDFVAREPSPRSRSR